MTKAQRDVHRCIEALRSTIRRSGITQLALEQSLGWSHRSLNQMLTRKNIRLDQLTEILSALGVEAGDFFVEAFAPEQNRNLEELSRRFQLLEGLMVVLVERGLVTTEEIEAGHEAVMEARASDS